MTIPDKQLLALKQPAFKILILYVIGALLFLTSVELHIHTQETAATSDHGAAVSISPLVGDLMDGSAIDEIKVSPDSVLKAQQNNIKLMAVLVLVAILITFFRCAFVGRLRERQELFPELPFYGAPSMRAPPL